MTESAPAAVKPWAEDVAARLIERDQDFRNAALEWIAERDGEAARAEVETALAAIVAARAKAAKRKAELVALVKPKPQAEAEAKLPAVAETKLPSRDEYLTAMNGRHAVIDNVGGKTVIASWEASPLDPTKETLVYHTKDNFKLRYSNRHVATTSEEGDTVRKPLADWWLKHRERRQYRSVTFQPGGPQVIDGCLNLWRCWGVNDVAGDWALIRNHIVDVVCGGNAEFAEYVIRWIAWAIQNPDRQAEVALVLIGEKGTGKGTLADCLQRIFGLHAFKVSSSDEVIGTFNGHLQDVVLLIADEAFWGSKYSACAGRLQSMITERILTVHPKGIGMFQVRNCLHIVMLAEPGWVIPAGRHERRYAALEVSDIRRGDRGYFKALHAQITGHGPAAMFHDLARMDLGDWHPREIPESLLHGKALQKQQAHSLPPLEQWLLGLLHDGVLPGASAKRPNFTLTRNLLEHAKARVPRLRWDLTEVALRNFLDRDGGKGVGNICDKARTAAANGWAFPPLAECRAAWERVYGPVKWDNPADDWGAPQKPADPLDRIVSEGVLIEAVPESEPMVAGAVPVRAATWRRL